MKRVFAAAGASAAVLLAACVTNGSSSLPPSAGAALQRQTKAAARLYVSDPVGNEVNVYLVAGAHQRPIATITNGIDGPAGLTTDSAGNLYVANTLNNTVTVYRRDGSAPVTTYSEDLLGPVDVAVDGTGRVYVANFYSFVDSIVEFPAGSTRPSITIRNPCSCYSTGLTLDTNNNLYAAYQTFYSLPEVYTYAPGSKRGVLRLNFAPSPRSFVAGLLVDKAANLLVADWKLPGVEVFPPGKHEPSNVFDKTGSPQFLQFASGGSDVFVTDTAHRAVEEYTYPGGHLVDTITAGLKSVYGVAVSPPSGS